MPPHDTCATCGARLAQAAGTVIVCPRCALAAALGSVPSVPFRIVTILARDDRAVTYMAQADNDGGHVALKIVGPCDVAAVLGRFEAWQDALTDSPHPHIARLLDVGQAGQDTIYFATEFVGGLSLDALLRRAALTLAQRADIVQQIADALSAAHARGIAHGSLDAIHIKVALGGTLRATLLGLGFDLIVDGTSPSRELDLEALARLARELDVAPTA